MSRSKGSPHHHFFLTQFQNLEFAISFLKDVLESEMSALIQWDSFRLAPGDFVQKALRNRKSDVLYETRIAGRKGFFYPHLEHQRQPHRKMPYRLLVYLTHIWLQHEKLYPQEPEPLILPLVLYQGKTRWTTPLTLHEYLEVPEPLKPFVPDFRYILIDLSHLSDEEIKGEVRTQLVLQIMKYIDSPAMTELLFGKLLPLLLEVERQPTGLDVIETILYYLSEASPHLNKEKIIEKLQDTPALSTTTQEKIMTLAEQWRQEGRQKGLQEGRQEGRQEGESHIVWKQLKMKFQLQAESYRKTLTKLSSEELERAAEKILTAQRIEDVFEK